MEIQRDFKNLLLGRREIVGVIAGESNPGFDKAKEELVNKLKVEKELVVIKKLGSKFGRKEFVVDAFVYNSAGDKDRIEKIIIAKKTKDEKPAEEKKDETKKPEGK